VRVTDAAIPRLSRRQPLRLSRRPSGLRRVGAAAFLAATALLLVGCGEVRIGSAAVVGDQRITDDQLQTLVDQSLSSPGVRAALPNTEYRGDLGAYRRSVLNAEVERLLAEEGVRRLGLSVDSRKVESRYRFIEQQSGGPERFASQLAARLAVSPALYRQLVRTEVIESEIGYQRGGVARPTEAELRSLYEQYLPTAITAELSLIRLPDAATVSQVLAQVQSDPSAFPRVAAQYAGQSGQGAGEPQKVPIAQLPADLVRRIERAPRGDIFSYTLEDESGTSLFVIRSGGIERPTLESARPQLEAQSLRQAAAAGQKYLSQLAGELGVDVNPRYGSWDGAKLAITDFVNPVIKPTATGLPTEPLPGQSGAPEQSGAPGQSGAPATPSTTGTPVPSASPTS
jgi:hypothetical protein